MKILQRLKIRLVVLVFWKIKAILLKSISDFQATEADGVWHLLHATRQTANPEHKAALFTHLIEEESHAERFAELYETVSGQRLIPTQYERKRLYKACEPIWKTVAYVHLGEEDATRIFQFIHAELEDGFFKQTLVKIIGDEEGHIGLTQKLALQMGAGSREFRREVFRIKLRRFWEKWLRAGRRVGDLVATVVLSLLYFLIGPVVLTRAKSRLNCKDVPVNNGFVKAPFKRIQV